MVGEREGFIHNDISEERSKSYDDNGPGRWRSVGFL